MLGRDHGLVDDRHPRDGVAPLVLFPRVLDASGVFRDLRDEVAEEALVFLLLGRGPRRPAARPSVARPACALAERRGQADAAARAGGGDRDHLAEIT